MSYTIPLSYNPIDTAALADVLQRYEGKPHQQIVSDFEAALQLASGAPRVVAASSGTAALHLALRLLAVGPGDTVIVSTFTYVASVAPVLYCGATPVFVDSEEDTWNMDPELLQQAIKELAQKGCLPKAIIVVHAYGMPARMPELMAIARRWQIPLVEDAAEAFGSTLNGRWAGTLGDMGIYSFNNNKAVTTFGGGALLLRDGTQAARARLLASHAREDFPYYHHTQEGYNYAISPLAAAYGIGQVEQAGDQVKLRREIFEEYVKELKEIPTFSWQKEEVGATSSRWLTTVRTEGTSGQRIFEQLGAQDRYEIRRVWKPMHLQPLFEGAKAWLNGTSEALFAEGLCLPSGMKTVAQAGEIAGWLRKGVFSVLNNR